MAHQLTLPVSGSRQSSDGDRDSLYEVKASTIDINGKGLFCTQSVDEGIELLNIDRPLIGSLSSCHLNDTCSNCYEWDQSITRSWGTDYEPLKLMTCTQCSLLRFCSKKCQAQAWKRFHKFECKKFGQLSSHEVDVILKAPAQGELLRGLIQLLSMKKNTVINDTDWMRVIELKSYNGPQIQQQQQWMIRACQFASDIAGTTTLIDFVTCQKLLGILRLNGHVIAADTLDPLGLAFDPLISKVNHDCSPNSFVLMDGAHTSIRSLLPIQAGSEITIAYVDETSPFHYRQEELFDRYNFQCQCGTCVAGPTTWRDQFPLRDQMSRAFKTNMTNLLDRSPRSLDPKFLMGNEDDDSKFMAAAQKWAWNLAAQESIHQDVAEDHLRHLETAVRFFESSECWPMYRRPYSTLNWALTMAYLDQQNIHAAYQRAIMTYAMVDQLVYQETQHHPVIWQHRIAIMQFMVNSVFESAGEASQASPEQVERLATWHLARELITNTKKSHGTSSRMYVALLKRFSELQLPKIGPLVGIANPELLVQAESAMESLVQRICKEQLGIARTSFAKAKTSLVALMPN